jgi:hypothetical protein
MASKAEKQYQKDLGNLLNQQFQAGQDYLNQQTANLQSYQPQYEQAVAQTYETQIPEVQRQLEQQKFAIGQQQEQTKQQRESALAEARRQYQEGTQRTQQLFGGVRGSSAGQAQSELLAREQQRQFGQTQTAATQNLGQLASNLANQEQQASNAIMAINADKQKALTQAKDQFRQQLDAINSQRFQLAQDKANKQIQALQDFNTRRRQLEDFYNQAQQNLSTYKAQQQVGLDTYAKQLALARQYNPTTTATGGLSNLAGANLSSLQLSNPQYAQQLAQQIARDPNLQKQFKATVVGNSLNFVDPYGNIGSIDMGLPYIQ